MPKYYPTDNKNLIDIGFKCKAGLLIDLPEAEANRINGMVPGLLLPYVATKHRPVVEIEEGGQKVFFDPDAQRHVEGPAKGEPETPADKAAKKAKE